MECLAEKENKAYTKTAPEFAVKNFSLKNTKLGAHYLLSNKQAVEVNVITSKPISKISQNGEGLFEIL